MADDLRPILDAATIAMVIVGADGIVRAGNEAAADLCGGDPVGRRLAELPQPRLHVLADPQLAMSAAGLAHELNNPLASLMLNLDLAARRMQSLPASPELDRVRDELRDAASAAERLRTVTRGLSELGVILADLGVPERPSAPMVAPRRARVLVVDDEPLIARAVRRILSARHDVTTVENGARALEAVRIAVEPFDVILCDLMMPEMSGMDLYDELARLDPPQHARLVFMTGGAFTPRARDFLAEVTNRRIDKPFEAAVLRALIDGLIA